MKIDDEQPEARESGRPPGFEAPIVDGLAGEVAERLRSSGGRPTDPTWSLARQVPFSSETWASLQRLSEEVSGRGRKVGPGQMAAILVEGGLSDLQAAIESQASGRH